jgi:uncharacterized membrane protein required for colicin V production
VISSSAGSSVWQLVFISFGCVLILLEVLRGWRRGLARQLARLGALIAAYFAAYFGGNLLGPWGRIFLKLPNPILSLVVGAFLGCLVYAIVTGLGTVLFKKTTQHQSAATRLLYGVGGAVLGVFFGVLLVWIMVVAVRSLGAVAEAQVQQESGQASARVLHSVDRRNGAVEDRGDSSLMTLLVRMKNSLELGPVGSAVKKVDVVPTQTYDTLGMVARTLSDPENAERFLAYPGARELADNPKIVALRDDPEIMALVSAGRFTDLLQNPKILDAANDATVVKNAKAFDLKGALDYALHPQDDSHKGH